MTQTKAKQLPEAVVYDEGLYYWPYRALLQLALDTAATLAPRNGRLIDMMCGPGHLLGKLRERRPDLVLYGIDIDERYVEYGRATYPGVVFVQGDVLSQWQGRYDMVLCTGAIHHVPYKRQEDAIRTIAQLAAGGQGLALISDCYVDDYGDETERKLAAAKLGYEYLRATILNGAPDKVVEWTADILHNDVLMHEFKPSLAQRLPVLNRHFRTVETTKTWPTAETAYGEYLHVCTV